MQDIADEKRPPEALRKRGRPSSGNALSDSARQARRRAKLEADGKTLLPRIAVSLEVRQALANYIQFKDLTLGDAIDRIVRDRLIRKRSGKRKRKEPTNG